MFVKLFVRQAKWQSCLQIPLRRLAFISLNPLPCFRLDCRHGGLTWRSDRGPTAHSRDRQTAPSQCATEASNAWPYGLDKADSLKRQKPAHPTRPESTGCCSRGTRRAMDASTKSRDGIPVCGRPRSKDRSTTEPIVCIRPRTILHHWEASHIPIERANIVGLGRGITRIQHRIRDLGDIEPRSK